jgi:hypothetical protein
MVESVAFLLYILKVQDLNSDPDTGYPDDPG